MNVGLFGGTFDPIHRGHLAVARAAMQHFDLRQVLFVPAGSPPHKLDQELTPYAHRFAMVALATAGEKKFIPSTIESFEELGGKPSYSVDTVRRLKTQLKKSDRLFFLIGIDAFEDIAKWREPEALLRETEFIVVSRPGFSLGQIGASLPAGLRPPPAVSKVLRHKSAAGDIVLSGATLHLLPNINEKVSATAIRSAARTGRKLESLVGPAVAEYIRKTGLYKQPSVRKPADKETSNLVEMKKR
jgi:nicotinate-nucleotide adenylyltransferase